MWCWFSVRISQLNTGQTGEGVNVVLWKTSPQPSGNILETPICAASPGTTRDLSSEGGFPGVSHCRVLTRFKKVDVRCTTMAAPEKGSAHGDPPFTLPSFLLL